MQSLPGLEFLLSLNMFDLVDSSSVGQTQQQHFTLQFDIDAGYKCGS